MTTHTIPHPRLLLFALALGGFAIGTTEFATMSLIPYIAAGLNISEPTAGHLISAYALGVVVGAPTIAVLAARVPRRTLLLVLMGVFALGHVATAMAGDYSSLLVWRFLSGLPHGAYFSVGVPVISWIGQAIGWRACFAIVAVLAAATTVSVACFLPKSAMQGGDSSAVRELKALTNKQVWLTLLTGAIGFGGMFAIYTYMASTLMEVTKVSAAVVPLVLALFGVGMTLGNLIIPRFAVGKNLMPCIAGLLVWSIVMLGLFPLAAGNIWTISLLVTFIGMGGAIGTLLQVRLMGVAPTAQTMAGALNNSAFNAANALGPFLGGLAINAGFGWTSTGIVGSLLAVGGLAIWFVSYRVDKASERV